MRNLLLGVLLTGLVLTPLCEAKRSSKVVGPACATGKLVVKFDDYGPASKDYRYYRCLLKQDKNGYLVQDFYWPSGKRQFDPLLISKAGLREWDKDIAGANGLVVGWHENGQKKSEANYVSGKATGLVTTWHENGQKEAEGQKSQGKPIGLWTFWYENGQKNREGNYIDGSSYGWWTYWYDNGQKRKEGEDIANIETGLWRHWYYGGEKQMETLYKEDGVIVSRKAWNEDGSEIDQSE